MLNSSLYPIVNLDSSGIAIDRNSVAQLLSGLS